VRVTADALNVRSTPDSHGQDNVLGGLHRGIIVVPIAREGDWLRVQYRGQAAYIHGGFVEPLVKPAAPAPASAEASAQEQHPAEHPAGGGAPASETANVPAPPHEAAKVALAAPPASPARADASTAAPPPPVHAPAATSPVGNPSPAIAANPSTESIAVMGTQLHNPQAEKIVTDLAAAEAQAEKLNAHAVNHETRGADRESFVAGIGFVRAEVDALAGADPSVTAFRVAVNHRLEELSLYHAQVNIRTIETGDYTTCNVTSLAMSLETIGKNADSYKASKRPQMVAVARVYRSDIAKATLVSHGTDPVWDSLRGLRLPDFMELAAIANTLQGAEPTEAEIRAAAMHAAATKTHLDFLASIAADFGAHATPRTTAFGGHASDLAKFADGHHKDTDILVDMRNRAEANPNDAKLRARYEAARAEQAPKINGGAIEQQLPLEGYKSTVMKEVAPHLDAGAGVISGTYNHFTHAYQITDEHIMVQDPGLYARAQRKLLWDEARALQYFWNYLVIT
jgi:hypothetical protein